MTMTLSADLPTEFKLDDAPEDCIQSIKFGSESNTLLIAGSWDETVRMYDVSTNSLVNRYTHTHPVMDVALQGKNVAWSGGLDNQVKMFDISSSTETVVGKHSDAVRTVEVAPETNAIVTGGWDSMVKMWDPRAPSEVGTFPQPDRVYTMSIVKSTLVVGTRGRRVLVWDLRNMSYVQQRRESTLKYQTRCIRCFPNGQGYVLSSIEGRVAVEYFDSSPEVQKKKYAFKCHRTKESGSGIELIYPVNAISFHPQYNTFATGGADGFVSVWDGFNKKRLCHFHRYPMSISSLAFSPDGNYLGIASSYMLENSSGDEIQPDNIFIRRISDQETKPK